MIRTLRTKQERSEEDRIKHVDKRETAVASRKGQSTALTVNERGGAGRAGGSAGGLGLGTVPVELRLDRDGLGLLRSRAILPSRAYEIKQIWKYGFSRKM